MNLKRMFIPKENLAPLIRSLKGDCDEFIAPKRESLDDLIFTDTKDEGGEILDYEGNSVISPRAFLLPQTEPLFEITSARDCSLSPILDKKLRIFYGVRPCDIKALTLMRSFFLDRPVDQPYKERLDRSIFVALVCSKRCSDSSFCHEMDAGPSAQGGFDLQLTSTSRGYLVDIGSKKGARLVRENKKLFSKAAASDEKEAGRSLKEFTKDLKKLNYKKLARLMREDKIRESVWDDIGERCVICSGCITLCPTCSCFSVTDRMKGDAGERIRYCDGCPYAGFTRMAGANSPSLLHKDHIRRFFEHKLNVDVERYGTPSCVGCGRCIQTCPGNISIYKFIKEAGEEQLSAHQG